MAKGKRYEGSPADRKDDKSQAKKRGVSLKAWEASSADAKRDKMRAKRLGMK
jgi:hypothetical protein